MAMTLSLIIWVILGWLAYWVNKIPSTLKDGSPITTVKDFFAANWKEFVLSIFGVALLCTGGDDIPESWGKITGPATAFIAGGAIPSMFMNFIGAWLKKLN